MIVAREMVARDVSIRQAAAQLRVDESTLRYHLGRPVDAVDGRRARTSALDGWGLRVRPGAVWGHAGGGGGTDDRAAVRVARQNRGKPPGDRADDPEGDLGRGVGFP